MSTVFLVRHGRTPLNAVGVLRGRFDTPLDEVGRRQARSLAELFGGVHVAAILSSPLARARDTAAALAGPSGLPVEIDDDLVDRDYGPWAGTPPADVEAQFGSLEAAPGLEARDAFSRRVETAVERAGERAVAGLVVVVAHDAVNRHALAALVPALGPAEAIPQRTGCWNRVEYDCGRWSAPIVDAVPGDGHHP